eukprot:GHVH01008146.1.p1 GENE.GHVH01008146.1~~GHVH01008146.1.p1  ORF type:complete len:239 (-),score=29.88 GHVH01008146.1:568-1284(-)
MEEEGTRHMHGEPMAGTEGRPPATSVSDLARIRKEYGDIALTELMIPSDPFTLFREWLQTACDLGILEPNACALATVNAHGRPSNRFVLLKEVDGTGFVWFTNYGSKKGRDLQVNNQAAMTFWWGPLEKSVRIEGIVERISGSQSDEYFAKRPRGAQLGALASHQSAPIDSQEALTVQFEDASSKFEGQCVIERPAFWGGYRLVPDRMEFWKGRRSRLHDRIEFSFARGEWTSRRLQP